MSQFALGLDLGPAAEFTALAVVERDANDRSLFGVRHLARFPPGTPYRTIGEAVAATVQNGGLGHPPIIADLTAVGPELLPILRDTVRPAWVKPVVLTAGQAPGGKGEDGIHRLPKRDLVTKLQLLLQERRLRVAPALPEAAMLARELTAFRPKVSLSEADAPEWRERPADDLVLAVALGAWWLHSHPPLRPGDISYGGSTLRAELDRIFPDLAGGRQPRW
jgi:hypothetical protein